MYFSLSSSIVNILRNEPTNSLPGLNLGAAPSLKRSDVLDWIPCTDFRAVYKDHLKKLYSGIGERLLHDDKFKDWFEGKVKNLSCIGMRRLSLSLALVSLRVNDLLKLALAKRPSCRSTPFLPLLLLIPRP